MLQHHDAIVIGSGQAGNPLAHNLADKGWGVALIEREHLGGSCINYGCTPTKVMVSAARVAHVARNARRFGVATGEMTVDLAAIVARKNNLVTQWRAGQESHAANRATLRLVRGEARFTSPRTVTVGDEELTAERIFINTGSNPRVLPIEGIDSVPCFTNRNIMDLEAVPEHLVIIGASYIGLEFGQMFRRFGSAVSVIEFMGQIVPREDADVAEALQEILEGEGIAFHLGAEARLVAADGNGVAVTLRDRSTGDETVVRGSHLLVAAGRKPNTAALDPEAAGIETNRGWIVVNDRLETSVPGIWALGDVTGGPAFTHISYNDFQIVFHNLFHEDKLSTAGRLVPYALFTDPELGRVGITEQGARDSGRPYKVAKIPMAWVARAVESGETAGLMKVIIDGESDRILGAAILGAGGSDLVQNLMGLMMAGAPWTLYRQAMFIHPTYTEGFFTLFDNVEAVTPAA